MPSQALSTPSTTGQVSVVVPSYNHERYVEECLRSILAQTLAPKELIVIDDGSTDGSCGVIERVLNDCPFSCEFYTRENRGLCNTLNEALDKATGEFFAYVSSDDLWLSQFIESRIKVLTASDHAPLVYGHSYVIDDDSHVIDRSYGWKLPLRASTRDMLLFSFVPTSPSIVFRTKTLRSERWNTGIKLEDFDLYLRLCTRGEFTFDPSMVSCWRTHSANTSKQVELMVDECIGAIERNADALRMTDDERAAAVRDMNIYLVDTLLDDGQRGAATKMFLKNIRGFRSSKEMLKRAAKLVAPRSVIETRRRLSRKYFQNKKAIGAIDSGFNFVPS